ncbi:sensor histidine kinase [Actinoallomurus iriomotensis]|uniref:Oxygen sensor histidine kinase NreB n=1 Tax=Actinoallomurus iriomotensis TaxID=478107 RepID=A0A9W6RNW5_9ACTN|nr:sensor histidine kinase [Actinoallomurus iriomotensis]GLY77245.1 two-component sensor histidine kinase [Actinoallomurus iriomotensis]
MSGEDAWELGLGRWEAYFALVLASTVLYVTTENGSWPDGPIAVALLFAMVPWYLFLGRRLLGAERGGMLPYVYVAGLVVLSSAASSAVPESALILFALCPQCYIIGEWWRASIAVMLLNAAPAVRFLRDVHSGGSFASFLTWTVVSITFSVFFGLWVERIIRQSTERRELIEQLEATRTELAEVSREAGAMAERERLAAEIHDTLAQGFTSILMLVQAAEPRIDSDPEEARRQLGLAVRTARENLAEARALVAAVPPAALGDSSLDEAVRRLSDRLGEELDVDTECVVSGEPRRLAARTEVVLLRAAQEGLANVRKHAKAGRVEITLHYAETAVRLEVRDDGRGFDPATASGFGLRGMRDRAGQVDGTVRIVSRPGEGTSISVEVPA